MASEIVEMKLPDGTTILVEGWDVATTRGPVRETSARSMAAAAAEATDQLSRTIRGYTELVIGALRDASAATRPDKATVSFGVKIGSKLEMVIAGASAEANVTVTAEWQLNRDETKG